jgi:hypothetical protein
MFQSGNALLMIMTILLALAGAIVTVFIVLEIIEIARGLVTGISEDRRYSRSAVVPSDRQITPFRDRGTVERVIDYLEEEEEKK